MNPTRNARPSVLLTATGVAALALSLVTLRPTPAQAQAALASAGEAAEVTWAGDVAAIFNENCVTCHRAGGIGPMELTTYEQVRPWAPLIREKVAAEDMPPYSYDRNVGIQELQEDWRLPREEIATILAWIDTGTPMGDPAELPPPPEIPDPTEWSFTGPFGPPDLVVRSTPIDVPLSGNDIWHRPIVPTGLTEDRCIRASQVRPADTKAQSVVHHAIPNLQRTREDGTVQRFARATEYAMGKAGEITPEGVCRSIAAGAEVRWDIHLFPGGLGGAAPGTSIEDNVVELGLWLHPEDFEYEYVQRLDYLGFDEDQTEMIIPPHEIVMTEGFHSFDHPIRIDSWQPHGHLRLRAASLEIFYPETGRTETISMVSDWSATWHHSHIYADDVAPLVPTGAVLIQRNWYDNTADNPHNPDPDQWVNYGSRTSDEMSHGWLGITHLDEEGYQRLLEERREREERNEIAQN
jgi:mono/diheme cytochrome c family protein